MLNLGIIHRVMQNGGSRVATSMDELMGRCKELGIVNVEYNGALSTDIMTSVIISVDMEID